jgi:ribosomal protein S18 acetylase RimI-like enzyme
MTAAEYDAFLETAIPHFAQEKVRSGDYPEHEALALSKADYDRLLPLGVNTPDHYMFTVRDADTHEAVAMIWLCLRLQGGRVEAYVYDIEVREKYRGQGYGRATMLAGIQKARQLNADTVGLHVFGHNAVARALYQSLGFVEMHVNMSLEL